MLGVLAIIKIGKQILIEILEAEMKIKLSEDVPIPVLSEMIEDAGKLSRDVFVEKWQNWIMGDCQDDGGWAS